MTQRLLLLFLAGGVGALARYGLAGWVQGRTGAGFPWGTLAVNAAGCLVFGLLWGLAMERALLSPETRTVLLVGFLGAFTTFSTFAAETSNLLREAEYALAAGNLILSNVLCIGLFFAGLFVARWI